MTTFKQLLERKEQLEEDLASVDEKILAVRRRQLLTCSSCKKLNDPKTLEYIRRFHFQSWEPEYAWIELNKGTFQCSHCACVNEINGQDVFACRISFKLTTGKSLGNL